MQNKKKKQVKLVTRKQGMSIRDLMTKRQWREKGFLAGVN